MGELFAFSVAARTDWVAVAAFVFVFVVWPLGYVLFIVLCR
jgi:hypothetical protein